MIRIIIACALISLVASAVIPDDAQAQIINYRNENDGSGNYDFSYETSNGLRRNEIGRVINPGTENQYVDVEGSFSYTDADGKLVEVFYRADQNGYHVREKPQEVITNCFFSRTPNDSCSTAFGEISCTQFNNLLKANN